MTGSGGGCSMIGATSGTAFDALAAVAGDLSSAK
jgi:hypothetical protein